MKRFIALVLIMTAFSCAYAQDWFLTATVSQNHQIGENKLLKDAYTELPGGNIAIGDNFSRFVGARLAFGFNPMTGRAPQTPGVTEKFGRYQFCAATGNIDVMFNVAELFMHKSNHRRSALYILGGAGGMKTMMFDGKPERSLWKETYPDYAIDTRGGFYTMFRAGLAGNIKLSHSLDLAIEGKYNFVPNEFNGRNSGAKFDNYLEVNIGVNWHFAQKSRSKNNIFMPAAMRQAEPMPVAMEKRAKVIKEKPVVDSKPKKEPKPVKVKENKVKTQKAKKVKSEDSKSGKTEIFVVGGRMQTGIYFMYDFDNVDISQQTNLQKVVKFLNDNMNANLIIHAYADTEGGNEEKNRDLAKRRADAVVTKLVKQYGIDASRLNMVFHPTSLAGGRRGEDWIRAVEFEMVM